MKPTASGTRRRIGAFLRELKRRHVYQVGAAYVVAALAIWGGAEFAVPRLGLPDRTLDLVLLFSLIGFPAALVLAWAFELTPDAGARPEPAAPDSASPVEARRGSLLSRPEGFPKNRVAILPLANISSEPGDEYFAEGMTEELISVVSRIRGLDVIARTSVVQYKNAPKGILQVSEELAVGAVLEGSVRREGDALRITVQLIDCATEGHLWSEDYDRQFADIFNIQKDIARQVAGALEVKLLSADEAGIERTPTEDLQAYDYFLLGRFHLNRRNDDGLRKAVEYLEKTIAADPGSAPAFAGLSEALTFSAIGYRTDPPPGAIEAALEAAHRAIEIDGESAAGFSALTLACLHALDFEGGRSAGERALELEPGSAEPYQRYAWLLFRRRYEEAIAVQERALELDPRSVTLLTESGWPYLYQGLHAQALERFEAALEIDPDFGLARFNVGNILHSMGDVDGAVAAYERAIELSGDIPFMRSYLARAYDDLGRTEESDGILADFQRIFSEGGPPVATMIAHVHEGRGNGEVALDWLEIALEREEPTIWWAGFTSEFLGFETLWEEPRFARIMERLFGTEADSWGYR